MELPDLLKQGEPARLIPTLADTNREQRAVSIFLSVMPQIPALASEVLSSVGVRVGKRTSIRAYTEVVFKNATSTNDRPDGLLVVTTGKNTWTAIVEAKIGKAKLDQDQVQRYIELARHHNIDAVITISNEFVSRTDHSPVAIPKNMLRKTGLYHWSWTWLATQCELLSAQEAVVDNEQIFLQREVLRFFNHPSTGVERFSQMGPGWKELVQAVSNNEPLKKNSEDVEAGVACWFEEERDLGLQLSRHVGQPVETIIEKKINTDPVGRLKSGVALLVEQQNLTATYRIPDSAADIEVLADLKRKTVSASMKLKAPLDRKSTKARINWILRMIRDDDPRIIIRAHWPGRAPATQESLTTLRSDPDSLQTDNQEVAPHSIEVILIENLGKRFAGRRTFIEDVERIVPDFYNLVGQHMRAWQAAPPKPVQSRPASSEIDIDRKQASHDEPEGVIESQ